MVLVVYMIVQTPHKIVNLSIIFAVCWYASGDDCTAIDLGVECYNSSVDCIAIDVDLLYLGMGVMVIWVKLVIMMIVIVKVQLIAITTSPRLVIKTN